MRQESCTGMQPERNSYTKTTGNAVECSGVRLARALWLAHEQPVVDVAQGVGHEGLRLVMPPLAVNDELVLVVPAAQCMCDVLRLSSSRTTMPGLARQQTPCAIGRLWPALEADAGKPSRRVCSRFLLTAVTAARSRCHSPWRQVHRDREGALPAVQRRHGHRLHPSRERPAQVDLRTG